MVSTVKDPVLAVMSLSGGNDGLNTVIPYNDPNYRDYRKALGIPEDQIIPITDQLGFHPAMAPLKKYWDEGKLARKDKGHNDCGDQPCTASEIHPGERVGGKRGHHERDNRRRNGHG